MNRDSVINLLYLENMNVHIATILHITIDTKQYALPRITA